MNINSSLLLISLLTQTTYVHADALFQSDRDEQTLKYEARLAEYKICIEESNTMNLQANLIAQESAQLTQECARDKLAVKNEYAHCLKKSIAIREHINVLMDIIKRKRCSSLEISSHLVFIKNSLITATKTIDNYHDGYQKFLYNGLVQQQKEHLKLLNDKGKVFDCQNKLLAASSKVILTKQRVKLAAFYGDLYTLNKGQAEAVVIEKYITFWSNLCKLNDEDYVKSSLAEIADIKIKYGEVNSREMQEKLCRILNRKKVTEINFAIELCRQFEDSDSYRYSLSTALRIIQNQGEGR